MGNAPGKREIRDSGLKARPIVPAIDGLPPAINRAFSAADYNRHASWGVAPGWNSDAPLALKTYHAPRVGVPPLRTPATFLRFNRGPSNFSRTEKPRSDWTAADLSPLWAEWGPQSWLKVAAKPSQSGAQAHALETLAREGQPFLNSKHPAPWHLCMGLYCFRWQLTVCRP